MVLCTLGLVCDLSSMTFRSLAMPWSISAGARRRVGARDLSFHPELAVMQSHGVRIRETERAIVALMRNERD